MQFSEIIGQDFIKKHLENSVRRNRIPHAQLFVGPEGSGTLAMAIAYSKLLLCGMDSASTACNVKFQNLSHPDLHFIFPNATNDEVKSKPKSADFLSDFREFVTKNPYGSLFDWHKFLGAQNKQGEIRVEDAQDILKTLALKSFEGGYKIMIVWMAEKMNISASNKLLKLLEEPPEKTVFLLVAEDEEAIIQTIRSRCQIIHFPHLPENSIKDTLLSRFHIEPKMAQKIAHQSQGNFNKALHLLTPDENELPFEEWFISWVRTAFRAKGNPASVIGLIQWSEEIAAIGREGQKQFLHYCLDFFRQALLYNYGAKDLVYFAPNKDGFQLEKFAPYVTGANILEIYNAISDAIYHIERNGNAKIILTDLSIQLTRLIHKF